MSSVNEDSKISEASLPFTIVGVGASAGGLEAYEDFFSQLPARPGCAFVLIMHLDPNHKSMLPDLLSKITDMDVVSVIDGMQVEPNRIHVIPPKHSLFIEGDSLRLKDPAKERGMRRPRPPRYSTWWKRMWGVPLSISPPR